MDPQPVVMHLQSPVPPTPSTPTPPVTMFSADPTSVFFRPFPTRWGDLPAIEDDPGIAALERETVTKPRPMPVESMKPFQPSKPQEVNGKMKLERKVSGLFGPAKIENGDPASSARDSSPSSSTFGGRFDVHADPRIVHSLQLNYYLRKMNSLIAEHPTADAEKPTTTETIGAKRKMSSTASSAAASSSSPKVSPLPPIPPLPASLEAEEAVKKEIPRPPFHPPPAEETLSPFAEGRWPSSSPSSSSPFPPTLTHSTCRQLSRKSIVTLLAHAGFDNASESAVDVLTDLLQSFLSQLTSNLADARDAEMTSGGSDFPDIVERVFTEMGVGSAKSLLRFYNKDVVLRHKTLRRQCGDVMSRYRALISSETTTTTTTTAADGRPKLEATADGDSKVWFANEGEGTVKASVDNNNKRDAASAAAVFKREFDDKETAVNQLTLSAAHSIVPGQTSTTNDATDYDADDDDDVITEPSSVKSIFESDAAGNVVCDGGGGGVADSGYDLVASTLISLASPNANKGPKKKKSK